MDLASLSDEELSHVRGCVNTENQDETVLYDLQSRVVALSGKATLLINREDLDGQDRYMLTDVQSIIEETARRKPLRTGGCFSTDYYLP